MVDDDCGGAALGLRSLAGIVDDERVEMRQRPERHFREAGFRHGERLARQPFEVAVLAEMDDGMGIEDLPDPGVESQIGVRRHQIGIVIRLEPGRSVAAGWLDRDGGVPQAGWTGSRKFPSRRTDRSPDAPALLDLPRVPRRQAVKEDRYTAASESF